MSINSAGICDVCGMHVPINCIHCCGGTPTLSSPSPKEVVVVIHNLLSCHSCAALRVEIEKLKERAKAKDVSVECAACGVEHDRDDIPWVCEKCTMAAGDRACKAEADRDRLRAAVEKAPHGCNCKSNLMKYWDEENDCAHPCDCWKAAALAPEPAP